MNEEECFESLNERSDLLQYLENKVKELEQQVEFQKALVASRDDHIVNLTYLEEQNKELLACLEESNLMIEEAGLLHSHGRDILEKYGLKK